MGRSEYHMAGDVLLRLCRRMPYLHGSVHEQWSTAELWLALLRMVSPRRAPSEARGNTPSAEINSSAMVIVVAWI